MVYEQLHTFTKYIQKVIGRSREILSIAHSFSENPIVPGTCVKKEKKSPLLGLLKNLNVLKTLHSRRRVSSDKLQNLPLILITSPQS